MTLEANRSYSFQYKGTHDFKPSTRFVFVEEVNDTSVLGRLLSPEDQMGATRRFRFDRMREVSTVE